MVRWKQLLSFVITVVLHRLVSTAQGGSKVEVRDVYWSYFDTKGKREDGEGVGEDGEGGGEAVLRTP